MSSGKLEIIARSYSRAVHNRDGSSDRSIAQSLDIYSEEEKRATGDQNTLKPFGFYLVYGTDSMGRS